MVVMALDHTRDFFHINAMAGNYPENIETTTLILFFTRFITHYCAPVFVFLAGTSAFLYGQNKSKSQLSKFLITRGIWLIFVELFITNFLWWFDITYGFINLQVIWAIGFSMFILGIVVKLPKLIILLLGLLIVFGHNALDRIEIEDPILSVLWDMLHQTGGFSISPTTFISFSYPVLPWIGVIFLGYSFGELYKKSTAIVFRKKSLLYLGCASIVLFFFFRGFNFYADLKPWTSQNTTIKTIISFFKITKYPPSLAFLLITLGPSFLILFALENVKNKITGIFLVFGRVPFFYYVAHIFIIHISALLLIMIGGGNWEIMLLNSKTFSNPEAFKGYGYSLSIVYIIWLAIVALLYPFCKKYMLYKTNNKDKWWLSYL